MEAPGVPGLTLSCCGIYRVRVNGGGPLAYLPKPPAGSLVAPVDKIAPWRGLEELASWLRLPSEKVLVNPLSWPLLTPAVSPGSRGGPRCITLAGYTLTPPPLTPLRGTPLVSCSTPTPGTPVEAVELAGFRVRGPWRRAGLQVFYLGDCRAYASREWLVAMEPCQLEVETGIYDYEAQILYAGVLHGGRIGAQGSLGPFQALSIGSGEDGFLAIASPEGVRVEFEPGKLVVEARGPLRLAPGGGLTAARLLAETLVDWAPVPGGRRGYGNLRSSQGVVFLSDAGEGWMEVSYYNPSRDPGMAEARLPAPGERLVARGPLGETSIPLEGDLARIPLAPGSLGYARINLSRKRLLLAMRMRSRGR